MVTCRFADDGEHVVFLAKGHASYAPKGSDIVCAAVSALLQAAEEGCINFSQSTRIEKEAGRIRIEAEANQATRAIQWTVKNAICEIAESYPEYVKVGGKT